MKQRLRGLLAVLRLRLEALLGVAQKQMHYVNGPQTLPSPLRPEEEAAVFAKMEEGDPAARETLIVHNLRLVVYIARKFENTGINVEDLVSIGTVGLIKAVQTFVPSKKIKLATYASRCIENEILMYLRKTSNRKTEVSIDEPLHVDWDGNELLLSDVLGSDADEVGRDMEREEERLHLLQVIDALAPREKEIMTLRFGLYGSKEYTQKQVADRLGISQSYISRLEKKIIVRLKEELERTMTG